MRDMGDKVGATRSLFHVAEVVFANRLAPEQGPVERFWPVLPETGPGR